MPPSLREDLELTREHIRALSSADRLAQFFAYLRYPGDARVVMTPEALQFSNALSDATRRIERLASVEGGALQVYLFELTSVTVAYTRALTRAFRNRTGNFLLVLTDDYQQLDFVLLEREVPGLEGMGVSTRSVLVRPRILSVDRRNPNRVALRVLRRFTLTEYDADGGPDAYAQYDKLSSAYTIAEWSEPLFNNRALFSDYYLNERLPTLPEWDAEPRNRVFRQGRRHFAQARRRFAGEEAAKTRQELVQPLLEVLGFRVDAGPGITEPDFHLYAEDGEVPVAFGLAYPWNRYLDGKDDRRDTDRPEENPGAQVVSLLEAGAAPWGIVTNGKIWRLYSARAHSRATNYYEIDLEETLASSDPAEGFRYFYLFFRAASFASQERTVAGETRELAFLDWLMEESASYARDLGERLKERVFERIFPRFAEGFIRGMGGPEALLALPEEEREPQLRAVFQGTLAFLYRLLFLLYAESRDLLPVRQVRGYYQISLQGLKEEIATKAGPLEDHATAKLERTYGDDDTVLYDRLLALFEVVDGGSTACNVPVYNGGLFITDPAGDDLSPEARDARFLQEVRLPDRCLALGLDLLARDVDPKRGDLGFIDYKSLGVRQLGSIYEGLLVFKLRVATEKMAVVEGKKTEEIIPYAEAKRTKRKILNQGRARHARERILPRGTVYLENDRRERRATGSFYTPDHIVKYIVRKAVGPVLDEKLEALKPRLRKAEQRFHAVAKRKREMEKVAPNEPALLQDIAGGVWRDLFDVKILDPAMGSGHFLVETVDYVTDRLVRFLDGFPFLATFFEGMRRSILDEMERQGVAVDPARMTDVTLLKRHVLKRCIYGVDVNPMAVELAKVSLWLDCFTLGAPLSFLDHHLRCGNSLIGAMARDVEAEMAGPTSAGQMTFLTGPFVALLRAAEIMRGISGITDVTLEQVQESGHLFEAFDRAAKPYKKLLDIYVARRFEVAYADEFLRVHTPEQALEMVKADPETVKKPYGEMIKQARRLYEERSFFHWDLEFPEIFINLERAAWKEGGGFDAVIGNPPYDVLAEKEREEDLSKLLVYIESDKDLRPALGRKLDLFRLFTAKAAHIVRQSCAFGFIIPMSLLADQQTFNLRRFLLTHRRIVLIEVFPQKDDPTKRVFLEAKLPTCILIVGREQPSGKPFQVTVHPGRLLDEVSGRYRTSVEQLESFDPATLMIPLLTSQVAVELAVKLASAPHLQPSGGILQTYQGEINETTMKDLLSLEPSLGPKVLRGGNIQRYEFIESARQGVDKYLNVEKYQREVGGKRVMHTQLPRFGYQRNAALDNWRRLIFGPLPHPSYCFDSVSYYLADDLESARAHLALLNSELLEWRFRLTSTNNHVSTSEIAGLPFRHIHFTTPEDERQGCVADLVALYKQGDYDALLAGVEVLLPKDDEGNFLAFKPDATGAEEKSDVIYDLLAHLAEQMIEMHKEKQACVGAFWEDLEALVDPDTFEDLREHGKQESSLWRSPACRPYVDQASHSTRHLDESLCWDEDCYRAFAGMLLGRTSVTSALINVFRKHQLPYQRLVERIAATDDLIDQVVYRLYGLTEEEIAVVEGREREYTA